MFEIIGKTMIAVFDELRDEEDCSELLENMDSAESDEVLIKYIKLGIEKIKEKGNSDLAEKLSLDMEGL